MHIGLICPESPGHLNPMTTLGRELKARGHRVTVIANLDAQYKADAAGLGFAPVGAETLPHGAFIRHLERLGELSGQEALAYTLHVIRLANEAMLEDAPRVVREAGIDALVVDQIYPAGATVAQVLGLPFVTICNALALNPEPGVPPPLSALPYDPTPEGRARNMHVYGLIDQMRVPILTMINDYRQRWNLPPYGGFYDRNSKLAQISQQPPAFDFPREELPDIFHYTGPFVDGRSGDPVDFPYERLDGRPLIYASLGTLQNRLQHVFATIAAACEATGAQLVISLGRKDRPIPGDLPGDPIVVAYAPQLELLKRASLVITHAGLNTALETLAQGVPMVAIPITNDQPGVASRIAYLGLGEVVSLDGLTAETLRAAVETVLADASYRSKTKALQTEMDQVNGVERAADIALRALTTNRPVRRTF